MSSVLICKLVNLKNCHVPGGADIITNCFNTWLCNNNAHLVNLPDMLLTATKVNNM